MASVSLLKSAASSRRPTNESLISEPSECFTEHVVFEEFSTEEVSDHNSYEENIEENLNYEFYSDSEHGSEDSSSSSIHQEELDEVPDFFDELGEVPNIDEISLSPEVSEIKLKAIESQIVQFQGDVGKFHDPLTGESLQSSSSSSKTQIQTVEESVIVEEDEEVEEEENSDDLLFPCEIDDNIEFVQELVQQEVGKDDAFEMEQLQEFQKLNFKEELDFDDMNRIETDRQVLYNTQEFLYNIIENVVEYCEDETPITLLRQNLDKMQLMQNLCDILTELDTEQKVKIFLNRKAVEHFRRKKLYRAISADDSEALATDIEKFGDATARLDYLLGREEDVKRVFNSKVFKLQQLHNKLTKNSIEAISSFEGLVQDTLSRENFIRLKSSVDFHLSKIHKTRMEISRLRYRLILKQHTLANLMDSLEKMETLGGGLRMRDFERLNAETQALGRKIEDRNAEWNKLIMRRTSDLHIMAHMKERQTMLSDSITIWEKALQELQHEKQQVRTFVYDLKMTRTRTRHEIRELSFQGGLLDKPALMRDYDETLERLNKERKRVQQLQEKQSNIMKRIEELELKTQESDELLYDASSYI